MVMVYTPEQTAHSLVLALLGRSLGSLLQRRRKCQTREEGRIQREMSHQQLCKSNKCFTPTALYKMPYVGCKMHAIFMTYKSRKIPPQFERDDLSEGMRPFLNPTNPQVIPIQISRIVTRDKEHTMIPNAYL